MGIYKRKFLRKEERNTAFDQEEKEDSRKQERKHAFDQEKKEKKGV